MPVHRDEGISQGWWSWERRNWGTPQRCWSWGVPLGAYSGGLSLVLGKVGTGAHGGGNQALADPCGIGVWGNPSEPPGGPERVPIP